MPIVTLPNGAQWDVEGLLGSHPIETQEFVAECLEVTGGTITTETIDGLELTRTSQHTLSGMTIQQNFVYLDETGDGTCNGSIFGITNEIIE